MFFARNTDLLDGRSKSMLHIAPEQQIDRNIKQYPSIEHFTIDIADTKVASTLMDVTNLRLCDEQFDVIFASHVLQQVPDDRKAMSELFRVLKFGGWGILQVPIQWKREVTYEDPSITDPAERERVFGQNNHVRIYGADYIEKLQRTGFDVQLHDNADMFSAKEIKRYGLWTEFDEKIIMVKKPILAS